MTGPIHWTEDWPNRYCQIPYWFVGLKTIELPPRATWPLPGSPTAWTGTSHTASRDEGKFFTRGVNDGSCSCMYQDIWPEDLRAYSATVLWKYSKFFSDVLPNIYVNTNQCGIVKKLIYTHKLMNFSISSSTRWKGVVKYAFSTYVQFCDHEVKRFIIIFVLFHAQTEITSWDQSKCRDVTHQSSSFCFSSQSCTRLCIGLGWLLMLFRCH